MKKTYKKVTEKKQTGYSVDLKSRSRGSSIETTCETMYIDTSGDVISIDHDTSCYAGGGFCTFSKEDPNFRRHVKSFMEQLLDQNLEEFKKMRNVLTGEWYEMAETVREYAIKAALSKFDF